MYRSGGGGGGGGVGARVTAAAAKEVILCAGAVGTPHLLMLSGVGDRTTLAAHGVRCRAHLPGVGRNLNDHPDFVMKVKCAAPVTLYPHTKPLASLAAGVRWLLSRLTVPSGNNDGTGNGTGDENGNGKRYDHSDGHFDHGICGSNHFDVVACVRSSPLEPYPDLQLTLSPIAMDDLSFEPLQEHAFQVHVGLMRAHSRGAVELASTDPAAPPKITCNYLADARDRRALRRGVALVRRLLYETDAFAPLAGEEIFPGSSSSSSSSSSVPGAVGKSDVYDDKNDDKNKNNSSSSSSSSSSNDNDGFETDDEDDDALDRALQTHCLSQWHLTSTARMGRAGDPDAVVDAAGRVHGVSGLRVIDASIMPACTNGNTNAPTIMLAEKLSDAILGKEPLAPLVSEASAAMAAAAAAEEAAR